MNSEITAQRRMHGQDSIHHSDEWLGWWLRYLFTRPQQ